MSEVGRKIVQDKGRQNRERPLTKALTFQSCTGNIFRLEEEDEEEGGGGGEREKETR